MKIDNQITDIQLFREIGDRIRFARIQSRIKQEELADRCGISRSALIKLEKGDGGTRLSTFLSVLRQLRILQSFEVFLPERHMTPEMQLELDRKAKPLPKTVRDRKKSVTGIWKWGDGVPVKVVRHA